MQVSVQELKNHLSEYLRRASGGEEVTVTSHGKAIVRLASVPEAICNSEEREELKRLRTLPWVRPGKGGRLRGAKSPIQTSEGDMLLSAMVLEDRQ